jgi:hypothetical protein
MYFKAGFKQKNLFIEGKKNPSKHQEIFKI